jgi:hypothetical protein
MVVKFGSITLDDDQKKELEELAEPGKYRVLTKNELPSFTPKGLRDKVEYAVGSKNSIRTRINALHRLKW